MTKWTQWSYCCLILRNCHFRYYSQNSYFEMVNFLLSSRLKFLASFDFCQNMIDTKCKNLQNCALPMCELKGHVRPDQEIQRVLWTIILYYYSFLNILTSLLSLKIALLFWRYVFLFYPNILREKTVSLNLSSHLIMDWYIFQSSLHHTNLTKKVLRA